MAAQANNVMKSLILFMIVICFVIDYVFPLRKIMSYINMTGGIFIVLGGWY